MKKLLENNSSLAKTLGFKILIICVIALLLLIPTNLIRGIISDRQRYQSDAIESIIEPIGGEFRLNAFTLCVPYLYNVQDSDGNISQRKDYVIIMPNEYDVSVNAKMNILNRGIFKAPIYGADIKISGKFDAYKLSEKIQYLHSILWNEAVIIISTANKQNFKSMPVITVNDATLKESERVMPNIDMFRNNGFTFQITEEMVASGFDFMADISIQGGSSINIAPMAGNNKITITSDWKDPSFTGNWLPTERNVDNNGFTATWQIPSFNTPFDSTFYIDRSQDGTSWIRTSFLLLNDNYQKTYRSIKYAILFIFAPFFALFLCEMLTRKRIHVIQYALIGLANVIFYLLLLSISEHLNFNISYFVSMIMVVALTSMYVGSITRTLKLSFIIAGVEFVIYIFLFGILQLTDYALLVGTIGLFVALALAMYFTRNINAYMKDSDKSEQ